MAHGDDDKLFRCRFVHIPFERGNRSGIGFRVVLNLLFWLCVISPAFAGLLRAKIEPTHTGIFRILDFADRQLLLCQLFGGILLQIILLVVRTVYRPAYKGFSEAARDDFYSSLMNFGWLLVFAGFVESLSREGDWVRTTEFFAEGALCLALYMRHAPFNAEGTQISAQRRRRAHTTVRRSKRNTSEISSGLTAADYCPLTGCPQDWTSAYRPLGVARGGIVGRKSTPTPWNSAVILGVDHRRSAGDVDVCLPG